MAITSAENSYQDYAYTGGMQSLTVPQDGLYKLEVWGAGGRSANKAGGAGGYSVGYKVFKKNAVIYVCVGQGCTNGDSVNRYNGGRNTSSSANPANWYGYYPGAGCTHMATATGELASLSGNRGAVLIVAGAGGSSYDGGDAFVGGAGGGVYGQTLGAPASAAPGTGGWANGGTQTTGHAFGYGNSCDTGNSGGGGGWYGGGHSSRGGAGGSGYIGGVPELTHAGVKYTPTTTMGGGSAANTNGKARITYVKADMLPVKFNNTQLQSIIYNGTKITSLIYNGTKLFMRRLKERITCTIRTA